MAAVQIDEGALRELQVAQGLMDALYRSPKHGMLMRRAIKELHPDVSIPEIDVAAPIVAGVNDALKKLNDRLAATEAENKKLRQERDDEAEDAKFWKNFDKVAKARGYTEQGREDLIKVMKDKKIPDPEVAAAYLDGTVKAKPIEPSGFKPKRWNLLDDPNGTEADQKSLKRLMDNPEAWMEDEAADIWNEYAAANRAA